MEICLTLEFCSISAIWYWRKQLTGLLRMTTRCVQRSGFQIDLKTQALLHFPFHVDIHWCFAFVKFVCIVAFYVCCYCVLFSFSVLRSICYSIIFILWQIIKKCNFSHPAHKTPNEWLMKFGKLYFPTVFTYTSFFIFTAAVIVFSLSNFVTIHWLIIVKKFSHVQLGIIILTITVYF